jgi:hypothetical protein
LLFSDSYPVATQENVRQILDVERQTFEDKYLGSPTPEGRMNKDKFKSTKDRLLKRLTILDERYMSMGSN